MTHLKHKLMNSSTICTNALNRRGKARNKVKSRISMTCFFPYNSRNLDTSFFIFRPTIVIVDDVVEALKHFSFSTQNLGCVQSAIFRSIHGNMVSCISFELEKFFYHNYYISCTSIKVYAHTPITRKIFN